jgi:tetratricopeptide (TPR) repeat protein
LASENRVSAFNELESYLVDKNLFADKLGADFDDLDRLSFQILLYIKQNRYGEIVRLGRNIQNSLIVIPDEKKAQYLEILQIIGDAFQKNGSFYGARDFYQQALEIDPENIDTLLRLRKNLIRLNGEARARDLDRRIEEVISPKEISFRNQVIHKGRTFSQSLMFDGSDIVLDLHFIEEWDEYTPLVTIVFNGRVIWEDYLSDRILSLSLETKEGENNIQVTAVNRPVTMSRIIWKLNNIK